MTSTAHDVTTPGPPRVEEVGDRGVISVDACSTERRTRAYLEAIRGVTDQPVRTLVNTKHRDGIDQSGSFLFATMIMGITTTRNTPTPRAVSRTRSGPSGAPSATAAQMPTSTSTVPNTILVNSSYWQK